jgi:dTDP-3,4-didehydro-2,6-dideoxy-alpha-D-glucose 3-reductase
MGCANIAQRSVIPAILSLKKNFRLLAVASRDHKKATAFSKEFKCKSCHGYQSLIEMEGLDAVYIPLPTGLHSEWINKSLDAGLHVYAEKSVALDFNDAVFMVENAKKKSLGLMEGYMFQYHPQHIYMKNLIQTDAIGRMRFMNSSFGFPPLDDANFRYNKKIGGGVVMDAAGYPLRAVHSFLGNNMHVTASSLNFSEQFQVPIWGSAYLSDGDGLSAAIGFGFDNFYQCKHEIWGSSGKIISNRVFTAGNDIAPEIIVENNEGIKKIKIKKDNHFVNALKEFHSLISDGDLKEKHYQEILTQSQSLDKILRFSLRKK